MDIELQKVNILLSQRKEMNNDIDGHINPIRINFNNIWLHGFILLATIMERHYDRKLWELEQKQKGKK
jgi:hypothetical protein